MAEARLPTLKVGTDWVPVEIVSEARVVMSMRGYAPVLEVRVPAGAHILYISSKSISEALEPLRQANAGNFSGLKLKVRKASEDKMAPYEVEKA
ncbi:MAG TPA: hypothetical protein VF950_21435 [Planctomycetota bacterium]